MSGPSFTIKLRCAGCNTELSIQRYHTNISDDLGEKGNAEFFIVPHYCPPEIPVVELPCDLTMRCSMKGTPMDDTTHVIYVQSDEANVVLASLSFHPECCPHWLGSESCNKRHS